MIRFFALLFLFVNILHFLYTRIFLKKGQNLCGSIIFANTDKQLFLIREAITEHVSLTQIMITQMVALNSRDRTKRKKRDPRKKMKLRNSYKLRHIFIMLFQEVNANSISLSLLFDLILDSPRKKWYFKNNNKFAT